MCCCCGYARSNTGGDALAAADAHGDQAVPAAVRRSSYSALTARIAPVAPIGCPSEILVALPADATLSIPVFDTVLNGKSVIGSIVGTRADLGDVFALHAAGRTRVSYETRPLAGVNEAIAEVLDGKAKSTPGPAAITASGKANPDGPGGLPPGRPVARVARSCGGTELDCATAANQARRQL